SYAYNDSYVELLDPILVREYDRDRKWVRTSRHLLLKPEAPPKVVFDRSVQDHYGDPGTPVSRTVQSSGARVLRDGFAGLLLNGDGATPKGDRPFLDRYNFETGKSTRLWECGEGVYEYVVSVLNDDATKLIIRRESPTEPPALYYREGKTEHKLA